MALSRRRFLLNSAAALAAAGAATLGGRSFPGSHSDDADGLAEIEALGLPVVLSVTDADRGELEVLYGETAIRFTDRALVRRLALATQGNAHGIAS